MIRVGIAGWSIPRSCAAAFPGDGTHLARYAQIFRCVEINSSFYRPHRREVYRNWASQTPRSFRFSVKLPREITHDARLRGARSALGEFLEQVGGLGTKLGPLLVQLPPSLEYEPRVASRFFALLRDQHAGAVACEPRHASWFAPGADRQLLRFAIGRVAADPAIVPAAALPGADTTTAYFRLHGSPRVYWSSYDPAQLEAWVRALREYGKQAHAWCIFDNTAANAALENALAVNDCVKSARRMLIRR